MATLNDTLNQIAANRNKLTTEALEAGVVGELVEAVRKASRWVGEYHKAAAEAMLRVLEAALAKAKGGK